MTFSERGSMEKNGSAEYDFSSHGTSFEKYNSPSVFGRKIRAPIFTCSMDKNRKNVASLVR